MRPIWLPLLALTLLTGCNDAKLKILEAESQQMKARLQILETEHPAIDQNRLHQIGREFLGKTMPDNNTPGFLTARASLAGVELVHMQLKKMHANTSEEEAQTKLIHPLYALQDMWPAYYSPANQQIAPMFQACRDLPILTRMRIEAWRAKVVSLADQIGDLEKLVEYECSLALNISVQRQQAITTKH